MSDKKSIWDSTSSPDPVVIGKAGAGIGFMETQKIIKKGLAEGWLKENSLGKIVRTKEGKDRPELQIFPMDSEEGQ